MNKRLKLKEVKNHRTWQFENSFDKLLLRAKGIDNGMSPEYVKSRADKYKIVR